MIRALPFILLLTIGCFESRFAGDGGVVPDAGPNDSGPGFDVPAPRFDVGPGLDSGPRFDAGFDSGPRDAGPIPLDVGGPDVSDAGPTCDPLECPAAPEPTCVDGNTLRVFGEPFCNEEFSCDLPIEDFVCQRGCEAGSCTEVCGEWVTDIVSGSGNSAGSTSLSIGTDAIYIAYSEGVANELRVANLRAGTWGLETVGRPKVAATPAEIVIDDSNGLHTLYSPPSSTGQRYAFRDESAEWRTDVVTTEGGRSVGTIAIDDSQNLHFVHRLSSDLGYARRVDGVFERFNIPNRGYGGPNSLALFTRGATTTVMVAVAEAGMFPTPSSLGFAERTGDGEWRFDSFTGQATSPALAVDSRGTPYIVDFQGSNLRLRVRRGGVWEQELAESPARGESPDSAFDQFGNLHVSFRDLDNRRLLYAVRDADSGEWSFDEPDSTLGTGDNSSIGVDSRGVHISHQSDTSVMQRELRYTRFLECR